jgi:indole-3-glycerol phosphate synthase
MLFQIVASRRAQLAANRRPWARRARLAPKGADLLSALTLPGPGIIAEVKPQSPSRGRLLRREEIPGLIRAYEKGGACAISVLAEEAHFQGGGELVTLVRSLTKLPILWKDFVISPSQIFEAKARGASGVLLISRLLGERTLAAFINLANRVDLLPLVEVHSSQELACLSGLKSRFAVGINNRNLTTFQVDLNTTISLLPQALATGPVCVVSESGIKTRKQVIKLRTLGVNAFLIGETLLMAGDPELKLRELGGDAPCG